MKKEKCRICGEIGHIGKISPRTKTRDTIALTILKPEDKNVNTLVDADTDADADADADADMIARQGSSGPSYLLGN